MRLTETGRAISLSPFTGRYEKSRPSIVDRKTVLSISSMCLNIS